jgi:hypothetical protein
MANTLQINLSFSQYRHAANAFANTLDVPKLASAIKILTAEQMGHSQQTSDSAYGLSAEKLRKLDSTSLNLFFQISLVWHNWLGIDSDNEQNISSAVQVNYNSIDQHENIKLKKHIYAIENSIQRMETQISNLFYIGG